MYTALQAVIGSLPIQFNLYNVKHDSSRFYSIYSSPHFLCCNNIVYPLVVFCIWSQIVLPALLKMLIQPLPAVWQRQRWKYFKFNNVFSLWQECNDLWCFRNTAIGQMFVQVQIIILFHAAAKIKQFKSPMFNLN